MERLNSLWQKVQESTTARTKTVEATLAVAERFWQEMHAVMATLSDLQAALATQEPPGVEPKAIQKQQSVLHEIRQEIDQVRKRKYINFLLFNV